MIDNTEFDAALLTRMLANREAHGPMGARTDQQRQHRGQPALSHRRLCRVLLHVREIALGTK